MTNFSLRVLSAACVLLFAVDGSTQPLRPAPGATGAQAATSVAAATARQTVVTVGGVAIKRGKIDTLAALMARARGADIEDLPAGQAQMLRRMVTTNLIGQELVELEARAKAIQAPARDIDSSLNLLKSQFPDAAAWQRALRQSGDTEADVRAKIARQVRSEKVLAANLTPPAPPTEAELRAFWEANKDQFPVSDSLRALQILLRADATVTGEAAAEKKRRLEALRRELAADSADTPALLASFMSEAARVSEGPEARIGGDLERFHPDDFHADFKKHIVNLEVGELSPVFRTPLGFHLVLLVEKYDGKFGSYRLQSLQNVMNRKNLQLSIDMRDFLRQLAVRYPVKYAVPSYRDTSESGIY